MALVVALGAARLFPVALIVAAVLMPLLTVLYLYDVNVYGNDPRWAYGWTVAWGAAAGMALGFLSRASTSTGSSLIDRGSNAHALVGGLAVPALGVIVTALGLLVLLRRRRFAEVLDGTTFAASSAATLAAAEAVVVGVGVLSGGLRPPGAAAPWLARLVAVAIATPVLTMSATALVGAALWLRYRAPIKDRRALGALGHPAVAIPTAIVAVAAGAVAETFMPAGAWLAWLVALDLLALVLLRRVLHVGLLEEASERDIGPPSRCANCDAMTATHTFCGHCGIALKALPKPAAGAAGTDAAPAPARGSFVGRLAAELHGHRSNRRRILASAVALSGVVAAAFAAGAIAAPTGPAPRCRPGVPCGKPPVAPAPAARYVSWRSSAFGFSLRYNGNQWSAKGHTADQLTLEPVGDRIGELTVAAVPASREAPGALVAAQVASLQGQLLGLASDSDPADRLLGTNVGFEPGPGAVYTATTTSPQGPQDPVALAILAAGTRRISILVTVIASGNNADEKAAVYQSADDIINSIQWPASA
jgi:hypothetical protein